MRVLLVTPPLLQCNAPYLATPLLAAWLKAQGVDVRQLDASLALVLRLLSAEGVDRLVSHLRGKPTGHDLGYFLRQASEYRTWVGPVVRFLQGKEPALALRLARLGTLPEGPRFETMRQQELDEDGSLAWAFGTLGSHDQARYLASLFVDDLATAVTRGVDPGFGLARYEERLCQAVHDFAALRQRLEGPPTLIDSLIDELAAEAWRTHQPALVGITVPFPGTFYASLRLARALRRHSPSVRIALGGGYVNTELRTLSEPALFADIDFVCLDSGYQALTGILRCLAGEGPGALVRTFVCRRGSVCFEDHDAGPPPKHGDLPPPDYAALPLDDYLPLTEMLNPMQVLWSSQRWSKLMAAHGCYWHRCSFCDTSLDYIRRFEQPPPARVVDWLEDVHRQSGQSGFHFVDEAMPPALVRGLCDEILRRRLVITWWGNLRLDPAFDAGLAQRMAAAGCIAVTAGLEAFDDRLLGVLDKGIAVDAGARILAAFAEADIMVHAYLMYGVPSQTLIETVNVLERVRQLFGLGLLRSAFWHRFAATVHSAVGRDPDRFGIRLAELPTGLACNEIAFADGLKVEHEALGLGLRKAVYNYMHGLGLDEDPRAWFDTAVPRPTVHRDWLQRALGRSQRPGPAGAASRPRAR